MGVQYSDNDYHLQEVMCMDNLAEKLRSHRLKVTPQRLAILTVLTQTTKHPDAENIYQTLRETHPSISLATVYKTLDTLKNAGLILELNAGEDSFRYDANTQPHVHLVCAKCRQVFDATETESASFRTFLDDFSSKMAFETDYALLLLFGQCTQCPNAS